MDRNLLEDYRRQVDEVDKEILILIKRRFQLNKKLGEYKHKQNLEIQDPNREDEIIKISIQMANEMNINESFVRKVFHLIMDESKEQQKNHIIKKFKLPQEDPKN
jgi:chorismate mutase